jgi:hypothetical protein
VALACLGAGAAVVGCVSEEGENGARLSNVQSAFTLTEEAPPDLIDKCRQALEEAHTRVLYCPPEVPAGEVFLRAGPAFGGDFDGEGAYVVDATMIDAAPWSRRGHWLIEGGSPQTLRYELNFGVRQPRKKEVVVDEIESRVYFVAPFDQGGGQHGGHVALYWEFDGQAYDVSFHGYRNLPLVRAVAEPLMALMKRCPPRSEESKEMIYGANECHRVVVGGRG